MLRSSLVVFFHDKNIILHAFDFRTLGDTHLYFNRYVKKGYPTEKGS